MLAEPTPMGQQLWVDQPTQFYTDPQAVARQWAPAQTGGPQSFEYAYNDQMVAAQDPNFQQQQQQQQVIQQQQQFQEAPSQMEDEQARFFKVNRKL